MKTSASGLAALKDYEKCVLHTYHDSRGVLTIGWGHTGPDVHEGLTWTQAQADAAFAADVANISEANINRLVKVQLTQGQFDALVSFVFNIGGGNFETSSTLKYLNAGDYATAATWLVAFRRAGPDKLRLLSRRVDELRRFVLATP